MRLGGFGPSILLGIDAMVIAYSNRRACLSVARVPQSIRRSPLRPFVVWFGFGIFPRYLGIPAQFFPVVATVMGSNRSRRTWSTRPLDACIALADVPEVQPPQALPAYSAGSVSATLAVVSAVVGEFGSELQDRLCPQIANGNSILPLMFTPLFVLSMMGVILFGTSTAEKLMIVAPIARATS
jgi:hypothetical protein